MPGGFPEKTGRAHNYFTVIPPWKAQMRKLAGTRAGQPLYLAFDTEMLVQMGIRVFRTTEAILSPDWIPNGALMFAYDARIGEFLWVNRAYASRRQAYLDRLKVGQNELGGRYELSMLGQLRNKLINELPNNRSKITDVKDKMQLKPPQDLTVRDDTRTLHKKLAPPIQGYQMTIFLLINNLNVVGMERRVKGAGKGRKGKGKGKGKGALEGAAASTTKTVNELDWSDCLTTELVFVPKFQCPHDLCKFWCFDGFQKCPMCQRSLAFWTDARAVTEVARLQERANLTDKVFALDQIEFTGFKRSIHTSGTQEQRGTRSSFGAIKALAKQYLRKARSLRLPGPEARLELDPFFAFNCAASNLTHGSLEFLGRLARALFPHEGRTAEGRKKEEIPEEHRVKICFIPAINRKEDDPLDVSKEAFVCFKCRFLSLGQFASYAYHFIANKERTTPLVHGWDGDQCVLEGTAEDMLKDLRSFAENEWMFAAREHQMPQGVSQADEPLAKPYERQITVTRDTERGYNPAVVRSGGHGKGKPIECFNCGGNHYVADCPNREQASGSSSSWGYSGGASSSSQKGQKGKGKGSKDWSHNRFEWKWSSYYGWYKKWY